MEEETQKEQTEMSEKEERIRQMCLAYYSRKDVQKAIFEFAKNREVVPRYFEGFGKRPDSLQYESDIIELVKKGATSFHCSEELWQDPLRISTEMPEEQLKELRQGWDLIIDIDSKYLDYSKISALLLTEALEFHGIKNYKIKFSGSKGFHILIPWKAFPQEVHGIKTSEMFPEWPRAISIYLTELIKKRLIEKITELTTQKSYIKDYEAPKKVMPDLVLVSSRHLFRMPYSLHEKTALSSVVLEKNEIENFQPKQADPFKLKIKNFYPEAREQEARELLVQALDWHEKVEKSERREYQAIKIDKKNIIYPPCITKILQGMQDGKKRALFILMNYFRSLSLEREEIEKIIEEWNKKNKPQLKQAYINSQLSWQYRQKPLMPPNCSTDWYKGIGICQPDNFCQKIKNPVNYSVRKAGRR